MTSEKGEYGDFAIIGYYVLHRCDGHRLPLASNKIKTNAECLLFHQNLHARMTRYHLSHKTWIHGVAGTILTS